MNFVLRDTPEPGVGLITRNRPEARNALSFALSAEAARGGVMLTREYTMKLKGGAKPAMAAEMLTFILD